MSNEGKLLEAQGRALRAQQLMEDELVKEAYDKIEADLIAAWIATNPRDSEGREKAWTAVHANRNHRQFLQSVIIDGKLAAHQLQTMADETDRKNRRERFIG